MGRARRKYETSRNKKSTVLSRCNEEDKSCLEEDAVDSNVLILPSKRDKKKRSLLLKPLPKKLSKKQRKRLEKVMDQKKKKEKRADLLSALAEVQVKPSELAMLDSVAHIGTRNAKLKVLSKRPLTEDLVQAIKSRTEDNSMLKGWTGKRKRRKLEKAEMCPNPPSEEDLSDVLSSCDDDDEEEVEHFVEDPNDREPGCEKIQTDAKKEEESDQAKKENEGQLSTILKNLKTSLNKASSKPATYVHVDRSEEIQEARLKLPILAEEQVIMEAITENSTVIVCGPTGSGKTTQVPQFLYEAGYALNGMIGITEPRRVAAVSMSKRVAMEMNLPSSEISYQIRYENNVTEDTKIKFMTDGILTRELKEDFLLTKYSVIVLDEAHERTANTDVLIGLLSRIVPLRCKKGNPLSLIIMSATLRIEDFTENKRLFKSPPPVIKIDGRQFPVTIHFNKKTPVSSDERHCAYLNEAYRKVCKIHRTLPPGGVLVFVTGRQEVNALKRKLQDTFPSQPIKTKATEDSYSDDERPKLDKIKLDNYKSEPTLDDVEVKENTEENDDDGAGSDDDMLMDDSGYTTEIDKTIPLYVLPLYSLLASHKQKQVFAPVPEGCRLCVVATNVAETSLTIPGIKYIVDTGKVKKKLYDKVTGVSAFRITWISKASSNQRAGRAGRTESGHAYRLYSSAVFQDFPQFDEPEIASKPVAGLVLQMKSMKIDRVVNFPFPTPPPNESLESAERLLVSLGALKTIPNRGTLKEMQNAEFTGTITPLGQLIASFPVHPRFGRMIAQALQHGNDVVSYVITIVAALTVREIFLTPTHEQNSGVEKERSRQMAARLKHMKSLWCSVGGGPERKLLGDPMVLLGAIGSAEFSGATTSFCISNCLRVNAVNEIRKLRAQLTNLVKCVVDDSDLCLDPKMKPPTDDQVRVLRQILLSALGDHVAKKIPLDEIPSENRKKLRGAYQSLLFDDPVFIHPESVMSRDPLPDYVLFQEILEAPTGGRPYMRDVTSIEPHWLATSCPHYCKFSKPLEEPPPRYNVNSDDVMCHVTATYGRLAWPLGEVEISYPTGIDRYRWFGRFFLEGHVITSLEKHASTLLGRPSSMVKSWSKLQPRTETLLKTLISKDVDNKKKLLQIWNDDDSTYLRDAYMEWLPPSLQDAVLLWPPSNSSRL